MKPNNENMDWLEWISNFCARYNHEFEWKQSKHQEYGRQNTMKVGPVKFSPYGGSGFNQHIFEQFLDILVRDYERYMDTPAHELIDTKD